MWGGGLRQGSRTKRHLFDHMVWVISYKWSGNPFFMLVESPFIFGVTHRFSEKCVSTTILTEEVYTSTLSRSSICNFW